MFLNFVLLVSLTIIILTALARLNDIGRDKMSKRWHVRRFGLVLVGFSSAVVGLWTMIDRPIGPFLLTSFAVGVAATWLTTPGHPPWWQFITGDFLQPTHDGKFSIPARIAFALRLAKPGIPVDRRTGSDRRRSA